MDGTGSAVSNIYKIFYDTDQHADWHAGALPAVLRVRTQFLNLELTDNYLGYVSS